MWKILLAIALFNPIAQADNLTPQQLKERLELRAEMYIMDAEGKRILSGPERTNYWRADPETGEIKGDWSSQFEKGTIALRHRWQVQEDGTIKVAIEEYGVVKGNTSPKLENLLEKKELILENFQAVLWPVKNVKNHHFLIRYIPSLREVKHPLAVDNLPLAGSGMAVSDSAGFLWAEGVEFSGRYVGITSHRGTLALSFAPFPGAKEMGSAEGNFVRLQPEKKFKIQLRSDSSFLPAGVSAKVYAIYLPEKKSKGVNSLRTFSSDKEERFLESLKN